MIYLFMLFTGLFVSNEVNITVTNISDDGGTIVLGFYKDQDSFDEEKPFMFRKIPATQVRDGKVSLDVSLESGIYGIALLHDENNNDEMDYRFMIPTEGYGFSNFFHTGFSKPVFDDFKFTVKENPTTVEIKVKYL